MDTKPDENSNIMVVEHLLIKDAATQEIILNQRQTGEVKKALELVSTITNKHGVGKGGEKNAS